MKYCLFFFLLILPLCFFLYQSQIVDSDNNLLLLEMPVGKPINIVEFSDRSRLNSTPIFEMYNNITVSQFDVFLSQYRYPHKSESDYNAGRKVVVLDRKTLKHKADIFLYGHHPTDVFIHQNKLFVKVRSINFATLKSGFEVYDLKNYEFIGLIDLGELFVTFNWRIFNDTLYVLASGISAFKKDSPNLFPSDKTYDSQYTLLFTYNLSTLTRQSVHYFGRDIPYGTDLEISIPHIYIAHATKYSKQLSDQYEIFDPKLSVIDIETFKIISSIDLLAPPKKLLLNPFRSELYISSTDPVFQIVSLDSPSFSVNSLPLPGVRDMHLSSQNTLILNQRFSLLNGYKGPNQIAYLDLDTLNIKHSFIGTFGPFPRLYIDTTD